MGLVPKTLDGKIQFNEAHLPDWLLNAVAIGSSSTEVSALQVKTAAARAALTEQQAAEATAKTKTAAFRAAVRAMSAATSDLVLKVRAKAATGGDAVYQLANIPSPATPSPTAPPGQPYGFKAELGAAGSLSLTWKATNPANGRGTVYQIYRRAAPDGEFTYIGGAGAKRFVDTTIPAGASNVTYQVQGVRSTAVGPWAQFNVNFGVAGVTTSAGATAAAKIAA